MSLQKEQMILWIIAAVLIALWLLGVITSTTFGGFIHVLLVIAVIVIVVNLFQGKKKLPNSARATDPALTARNVPKEIFEEDFLCYGPLRLF